MLSTDPHLQFRPRLSPAHDRPLDQYPDAGNIQSLKRIEFEDPRLPLVNIYRQKPARIVSRQSHSRLRQIIGPERKEFGYLGDLARQQSRPWQLDHRPHNIFKLHFSVTNDAVRHFARSL